MPITRSPSVALFVAAEALVTPGPQPHFLTERLLKRPQRGTAEEQETHTRNREAFLRNRIFRLQQRKKASSLQMHRHRQRTYSETHESRKNIAESMHDAGVRQQQVVHEIQRSAAIHQLRVREIARKQHLLQQEQLDKYRRDLDHKIRSSSERRTTLMRRTKSQILDPIPSHRHSTLSPEEAALRIQRIWVQHRLAPLIREYRKHAIRIEELLDTSLPILMRKVQEPGLIAATTKLIMFAQSHAHTQLALDQQETSNSASQPVAKIFLVSYMIVPHPDEIFADVGPEENDLRDAASTMLTDMHAWLSSYRLPIVHGLLYNFVSSWRTFRRLFELWKSKDTAIVIDSIVEHWLELERIWLSTRDNPETAGEWVPQLRKQQGLLLKQVSKVVGGALGGTGTKASTGAVKEGIDAFHRKWKAAAILEFGEIPSDTLPEAMTVAQADSVMPRSTSSNSLLGGGTAGSQMERSRSQSPLGEEKDRIEEFGDMLSNEMMAHELIMDPDYKMERPKMSALELAVTEMAEKAFFDKCLQDLQAGDMIWMEDLIHRVYKKIMEILPEGAILAREIDQVFDREFIKQQLQNKVFDATKMLRYVVHVMKQLAAPVRDSAIASVEAQLSSSEDQVEAGVQVSVFRSLLTILDDMALDSANHHLQTIKPHLKQIASEYESTRFTKALSEGRTSLSLTTAWLQGTVDELVALARQRNPENVMHGEENNVPKFERVYTEGLISLLSRSVLASKENTPETFGLDLGRLGVMQNEVQGLSIVAAIIMLVKNVAPVLRQDSVGVGELKRLLLVLLESDNTNMDNLTLGVIDHLNLVLVRNGQLELKEDKNALIRSLIDKTLSIKDSIFLLIQRRVLACIREVVLKGELNRGGLSKQGLDCVEQELDNLSRRVYALAKFNREVYAQWYDTIIRGHLASKSEGI